MCCIPVEDDTPYRNLVREGWGAAYSAYEQVTEREAVLQATVLKGMSYTDALAWLRSIFSIEEGVRRAIDDAYERFLLL